MAMMCLPTEGKHMDKVIKNSDGSYTINGVWLGRRYSRQITKEKAEQLKLLAQQPRMTRGRNYGQYL